MGRSNRAAALLLCLALAGCHLIYPFGVSQPEEDLGVDAGADTGAVDASPYADQAPAADAATLLDVGPDAGLDAALDLPVAPEATVTPDLTVTPDTPWGPDLPKPVGANCGAATECQTGFCADGYCCTEDCDDICETCKAAGKQGTCTPVPATPKIVCSTGCSSGQLDTKYCDGKGGCGAQSLVSCPNHAICKGGACPAGCATGADCIKGSLSQGVCDRSAAHATGLGSCVDPDKVREVAPTTSVTQFAQQVANALGSGQTHLLLKPGGSYTGQQLKLSGASNALTLVGDGKTLFSAAGAGVPTALVVNGATLTLQGLILSHAATGYGPGAACQLSGTLTIVESTIKDNGSSAGVKTDKSCGLVLRRSWIENNKQGGLDLAGGTGGKTEVVNNVIYSNGSTSSPFGGMRLVWHGTQLPLLYNNTVVSNQAGSGGPSGIQCDTTNTPGQKYKSYNTIVWYNAAPEAGTGCDFDYSAMKGLSGPFNVVLDPKLDSKNSILSTSPCKDKGKAVTGITVLDYLGLPRPKGGGVDMGAYEAF